MTDSARKSCQTKNMSEEQSKLWLLGPPISVALLIGACYFKIPDVRKAIDARCPYFKVKLAERGYYLDPPETTTHQEAPPVLAPEPAPAPVATPRPKPVKHPTPAPVAQSTPQVAPPLDIFAKLGTNRAEWPKLVLIKKLTLFPLVEHGIATGNQYAKPGTEATLVTVKDGKLGLEFKGGGAWVLPEDTDLAERIRLRN